MYEIFLLPFVQVSVIKSTLHVINLHWKKDNINIFLEWLEEFRENLC